MRAGAPVPALVVEMTMHTQNTQDRLAGMRLAATAGRPSALSTVRVVNKDQLYISTKALKEIGSPAYIQVLIGDQEFAIQTCRSDDNGARKINTNRHVFGCTELARKIGQDGTFVELTCEGGVLFGVYAHAAKRAVG